MTNARRVGIFISNSHAYDQSVQEGVSTYCQIKKGWKLSIDLGDPLVIFGHLADHVDGVISGITDPKFAATLEAWGKPCVNIYDTFPAKFPGVCHDLKAISRVGAEHLLALGLKHFAFCGFQRFSYSQVRQEAFEAAVQRAGCSCIVRNIDTRVLDWSLLWKTMAEWVAGLPKPIGLMTMNDLVALEVLDACRDLDIRVPDQVAVLGTNNDLLLCQRAEPPLSSVDPGTARIGFQAAAMLDEMMAGKPVAKRTILLPPLGVVSRASTDVLVLDDPQIAAIMHYIREHACDPMQVNDLLSIVPLSRRTMELRFLQARGRSLHEEIRLIQLQRAMRLLGQTYLPLDQVARASGFSGAEWLVKVFRKEMGITPGNIAGAADLLQLAAHGRWRGYLKIPETRALPEIKACGVIVE